MAIKRKFTNNERRTINCHPIGIDEYRVVHVISRCDEGLNRGGIAGRVREDALRVERDDLDLRVLLYKSRQVPEHSDTWLGGVGKKPRVSPR